MSEKMTREEVEKIYDDALDYWLTESECRAEMRELGVPNDADAVVKCNMGELRKLRDLALAALEQNAALQSSTVEDKGSVQYGDGTAGAAPDVMLEASTDKCLEPAPCGSPLHPDAMPEEPFSYRISDGGDIAMVRLDDYRKLRALAIRQREEIERLRGRTDHADQSDRIVALQDAVLVLEARNKKLESIKADNQEIVDYVMGYFPVGLCYVNPLQAINVVIERMKAAEAEARESKRDAERYLDAVFAMADDGCYRGIHNAHCRVDSSSPSEGEEMSDIEMVRACAEAMGYRLEHGEHRGCDWYWNDAVPVGVSGWKFPAYLYNPLHDDAQAMALVKKFRLDITSPVSNGGTWGVSVSKRDPTNKVTGWKLIANMGDPDLNRAIVECVAKMVKK